MPEFIRLIPPEEAKSLLFNNFSVNPESEIINSINALGRVTFSSVCAPHSLPTFRRSTVDGYAVIAKDTYGASESLPAYLDLQGEIQMGTESFTKLFPHKCMLIHTGGYVPEGADAVVMVEQTQKFQNSAIEIRKAVAVGENVIQIGEDIKVGEEVIPSGKRIREYEIGGLMALGILSLKVVRKPVVGIISSGDEVVHPIENPRIGQVRDINSYSLSALVERCGGFAKLYGIVPDQIEALDNAINHSLNECDILVITAGSSASERDLTAKSINRNGNPGVLVHGVNVKPGKPTILSVCNNKVVIGLPGNPVSALVIANLFLVPVIERLLGIQQRDHKSNVKAILKTNLPSISGREDYVPVKLNPSVDGFLAEPIFGKSNLIFTLIRADGWVKIPADITGIKGGDEVEVFLMG